MTDEDVSHIWGREDLYCAEPNCGLPAEYVGDEYRMAGAGFGPRGTECIVTFRRVCCVAGHRYAAEIGSVEIPPPETPEGGN